MAVADWKPAKLDELGFVGRGKSRHRRETQHFSMAVDYPFFQTGDIKAANFDLTELLADIQRRRVGAEQALDAGNSLHHDCGEHRRERDSWHRRMSFQTVSYGFVADPDKADVRFIKYLHGDLSSSRCKACHAAQLRTTLSVDKLFDLRLF